MDHPFTGTQKTAAKRVLSCITPLSKYVCILRLYLGFCYFGQFQTSSLHGLRNIGVLWLFSPPSHGFGIVSTIITKLRGDAYMVSNYKEVYFDTYCSKCKYLKRLSRRSRATSASIAQSTNTPIVLSNSRRKNERDQPL